MERGDSVWVKSSDMKSRAARFEGLTSNPGYSYVVYESGNKDMVETHKIYPMSNTTELNVATKYDDGKNRLELIPISGIEGIGRAMTFGSKKYADHNWANGFDYSRLVGSAMRHLFAWTRGQDKDPESGLSHLDHLGACVVMLIAHETERLGKDDRRKTDY